MDGLPAIAVATYNVLADVYIKREYYPRTRSTLLLKENRYPKIIERIVELRDLDLDIICLQEVDYELFSLAESRLRNLGYEGRWAHKSRGRLDGCATFISTSWRVMERRIVVYEDEGVNGERSGYIALLTAVEKNDVKVVIANTHLKWDPPGISREKQYGFIQAAELLKAIGDRAPKTIICGDFNAEWGSDVLDVFSSAGFMDAHDHYLKTANPEGKAKKIDYILCNSAFSPHPFSATVVTDETPLPSEREPSDHILLAAGFTAKPPIK